jgi:hypothetical protein
MSAGLAEHAIEFLVGRHWPMLPSRGQQKKPCVSWKRFQTQLPTAGEIRAWQENFNPERWGVVTGITAGVIVADFDGDLGLALMQQWNIQPHVQTGSGGYHLYVRHPGWKVPTLNAKAGKVSWPWPGLDVRGDGGFAVLLGRNKNGPYVHLRPLEPAPFDVLPRELRDFLKQHSDNVQHGPQQPNVPAQAPTAGRVDPERLIRKALEIASGIGRNNAGFWLACQLRDNGYSESEAKPNMWHYHSRVRATNMKGEREPYTGREMLASLREAFSGPRREPWGRIGAAERASSADLGPQDAGIPRGQVADDPDSLDIYVVPTGGPLVAPLGGPLSRAHYSRVPREVASDRRLKHRDVRVYAVLSSFCWQGNVSQVGRRLIAKLAPCVPRKVPDSLRRLESAGHIQIQPGRRGQRAMYILLSPVFGQKQRAGVDEIISTPNGNARLVSVRKDRGTAWTPCQPQRFSTKRSARGEGR